ncbi:glycine-rich cell wall structural protein 2-like [Lingula anatina]|uniref:Glycine-rich cell wall structural protein 2-like n=1 Tax=Lingula anatina TaxID=7574 RepID=A0A1S3K8X0_LINAN|nr:glycine-rich cell wall structural protein 2-like [Lingula anatina]|eukprot:XP_013418894.1 glycine-rich cell wall structural protein 2-like [Lingula anatina]
MMKLFLLAALVALAAAAVKWDSGSKRTHYGYQPGGYGNGDNGYNGQGYGYGDRNGYHLNGYNSNGGGYGYKGAGYGKPQYGGKKGLISPWGFL